jgi:hypothetical protein
MIFGLSVSTAAAKRNGKRSASNLFPPGHRPRDE